MKEKDNIIFYNSAEISEKFFHNRVKQEEIIDYFEAGKIEGKKIDNEWHADEKTIEDFIHNVYLKEKSYDAGLHKVDLSQVILKGRILDIGGGGEGIIAQIKGESVVAIDPNKEELEEAPSKVDLKIVMDAKYLKFLDNTFDTVTSFYTLMYIPKEDHKRVFQEIYRVLKNDGEFVIWDSIMPTKGDNDKLIFFISLEVNIGAKKIESGYGVQWKNEQNSEYFSNLAKDVGFEMLESNEEKFTFYLRLRKK